jgi:transcriptional regulator with XRE-family HTH domain
VIRIEKPEDLGETLVLLRYLRGMTQLDVARIMDTHATRVGKTECGVRIPHTGTLLRHLAALGYGLAIVPLIEGGPETAPGPTLSDQGAETHTRVGVDHSEGATGLSGRLCDWPGGPGCGSARPETQEA